VATWRLRVMEEGGEVRRYKLDCPICGCKDMEVAELIYDIPVFGKALLSSMICPSCGYRRSDVMSLEFKPPARYEVRVEGPEDLCLRVVRSSTATITIPELGVEIKPGPASEGFISNVEGVLHRVRRVAEQLLRDSEAPEERAAAEEVLRKIDEALEGRLQFTLIIDDPFGNSFIAPKQPKGP